MGRDEGSRTVDNQGESNLYPEYEYSEMTSTIRTTQKRIQRLESSALSELVSVIDRGASDDVRVRPSGLFQTWFGCMNLFTHILAICSSSLWSSISFGSRWERPFILCLTKMRYTPFSISAICFLSSLLPFFVLAAPHHSSHASRHDTLRWLEAKRSEIAAVEDAHMCPNVAAPLDKFIDYSAKTRGAPAEENCASSSLAVRTDTSTYACDEDNPCSNGMAII